MTDAGTRRATRTRDESSYPAKRFRGAEYRTSRQTFRDLSIVVKRFPGSGRGQAYVLVHGLGVSSRYYRPLAVELAKTGRVYVVELPGYGAAPDPRRDVSIDDHAAVLLDFLAASDLDDAVLVGHSMGSQIVARAALLEPHLVQRVVLMAPTMVPRARSFWRGLGRLMLDGFFEPLVVTWIVVTDYLVRAGPRYVLQQTPHMFGDHLEDYLPDVRSNVLVLIGDRDPIAREPWGQQLASAAPRGILEVVHGPHVVMYSDPVTVARHISGHAER